MRSYDTLAMKSSWLPLTGPEDGGAVYSGCWVCAGGGGSSSGAFLAQAARAMMDVAMIRCREIFFIFFLLERWFRPPFLSGSCLCCSLRSQELGRASCRERVCQYV